MKSKTIIIALASLFILASCTGKSKKVNEAALWDEKPQQTVTAKAETPQTQVAETVVEPTVETKAEKVTPTAEKPTEQKTTQQTETKKTTETDDNKIYEKPDVEAVLPLSNRALGKLSSDNIRKFDAETEGLPKKNTVVNLRLTVEKDGSISNAEVEPSLHPAIDKEYIKFAKLLPKCTPAKVNGKPVRSKLNLGMYYMYKEH